VFGTDRSPAYFLDIPGDSIIVLGNHDLHA
jgi:hypothetical protein